MTRLAARIAAAAAVVCGVWFAARKAWLCDDAFISFRYAENLTHGLGLVYNAGERVEGYSNFLWTVWIAFGTGLGVPPEIWTVVWGVVFFAATIGLLAALAFDDVAPAGASAGRSATVAAVPIAALLVALHPDAQTFATGGLETSAFTFLVTLGYALAALPRLGERGVAGAGLVFALVAMTRPDGLLFAPIAAAYVGWTRRPHMRAVLLFAGAFAIAWLPYLVWKLAYYGDWLPNTYYAKSADLAWWAQGWTYVRLYLARYWIAALAVPVGLVAIGASWRRGGDAPLALALAMALVYTTFVARAGGDFMYARLLIPVTPLPLIALERGIATLVRGAAAARWAFAGIAIAAMALTPVPLRGTEERSGIVNEPLIYTREALARTRREGSILRRYFAGLPVSVAYCGSQAALMYYSRPAVAIESEAGLTDAHIAHQRLAGRGRVGHEKQAPVPYLLDRRVNFVIHRFPSTTLHLDDWLPLVSVGFDTVPARIVHWDAPLLAEMRRRGADFLDVPSSLDKFIAGMDTLPDDDVRQDYVLVKRFYFDFVSDPAREEMFRRRLARARPS